MKYKYQCTLPPTTEDSLGETDGLYDVDAVCYAVDEHIARELEERFPEVVIEYGEYGSSFSIYPLNAEGWDDYKEIEQLEWQIPGVRAQIWEDLCGNADHPVWKGERE